MMYQQTHYKLPVTAVFAASLSFCHPRPHPVILSVEVKSIFPSLQGVIYTIEAQVPGTLLWSASWSVAVLTHW